MNDQEIQKILDGLFYKPGWSFKVTRDWSDRPMLGIRAEVLDSTTYPIDPYKIVTVVQNSYLPLGTYILDNKMGFLQWLQGEIFRLEKHESQEWLRSYDDGKPIDDPHKHDRRL